MSYFHPRVPPATHSSSLETGLTTRHGPSRGSVPRENKIDLDAKCVYALQLHKGKYYVGSTKHFSSRLQAHQNGRGSAWTQHYGYLRIHHVWERASLFEEDKQVLEYMHTYGVHNVRGGKYSNPILTETQIGEIASSMRHADSRCFNCGLAHLLRQCPNRRKRSTSRGRSRPGPRYSSRYEVSDSDDHDSDMDEDSFYSNSDEDGYEDDYD